MKRQLSPLFLLTLGLIGEVGAAIIGGFVGSVVSVFALVVLAMSLLGFIRDRKKAGPKFTNTAWWRLAKVLFICGSILVAWLAIDSQDSSICYSYDAKTGLFDFSKPDVACLNDVRFTSLTIAIGMAVIAVALAAYLRALIVYIVGKQKEPS